MDAEPSVKTQTPHDAGLNLIEMNLDDQRDILARLEDALKSYLEPAQKEPVIPEDSPAPGMSDNSQRLYRAYQKVNNNNSILYSILRRLEI